MSYFFYMWVCLSIHAGMGAQMYHGVYVKDRRQCRCINSRLSRLFVTVCLGCRVSKVKLTDKISVSQLLCGHIEISDAWVTVSWFHMDSRNLPVRIGTVLCHWSVPSELNNVSSQRWTISEWDLISTWTTWKN